MIFIRYLRIIHSFHQVYVKQFHQFSEALNMNKNHTRASKPPLLRANLIKISFVTRIEMILDT